MDSVLELKHLYEDWRNSPDNEGKQQVWHQILQINRDQVFCIGLISGVLQPVVVNNALNNVPEEGVYNFKPSAYFGVYKPDTFWFDESRR